MKSFAIIAALAVAVAAQSTPEELAGQLPECALDCIHKAGEEAGCEEGDYACECENQEAITTSAALCNSELEGSEKCGAGDLAKALDVAGKICAAVEAGEGDDEESSTATDDEASATESDASASETDSATDAEETDDAEETESSTESSTADASSTDSGDDAEESGEGDSEDGEGDAEEGDDADGAAVKLGSFGWAGAVAALAAFVF